MKKLPKIIFVLLLLVISACQDGENPAAPGKISFSAGSKGPAGNGRTKSGMADATKLFVSIERTDGSVIFERKELPLLKFGDKFLSGDVSLAPGTYKLTSFLAADPNNNILLATPVAGSELAVLVTRPLPIEFTVTSDQSIVENIEVVETSDTDPETFGYAAFDIRQASNKLVRIIASTGQNNPAPRRIRAWVRNLATNDRKWLTLTQTTENYQGSLVLPKGEYEFEAFLEWAEGEMRYAKIQRRTVSLNGNTTLWFDDLDTQAAKRIRSYQGGIVITTPLDFCDQSYTMYFSNDVCWANNYFEKYIIMANGDYVSVIDQFAQGEVPACNGPVALAKVERVVYTPDPLCVGLSPDVEVTGNYFYLDYAMPGAPYQSVEFIDEYIPENRMIDWGTEDAVAAQRLADRREKAKSKMSKQHE